MKTWLLYSIICLFLWGFWGIFGKLASRSVSSLNLLLFALIGNFIVFPIYLSLFFKEICFKITSIDYYLAILAGVIGTIGGLFFYLAISHGEATRVVLITALYPIITIVFSYFFLNEQITIYKFFGILFAVVGIVMLSL